MSPAPNGAARNPTVRGAGRVSAKRHPAVGTNVESLSPGAAPTDHACVTNSVLTNVNTTAVATHTTDRTRTWTTSADIGHRHHIERPDLAPDAARPPSHTQRASCSG